MERRFKKTDTRSIGENLPMSTVRGPFLRLGSWSREESVASHCKVAKYRRCRAIRKLASFVQS